MTDAPEKIWAYQNQEHAADKYWWDRPPEFSKANLTPYIRDDVKEAEKRAEYWRGFEDAAKVADHHKIEALKALQMARPDEHATRTGCQSWSRAAEKIAKTIRALAEKEGG